MTLEIAFMFALLIVIFWAFVKEMFPPDVVAMSGMALLLALGIISTNDALSVFSNHAPITIAAMFIISAALERTGCLDILGKTLIAMAGKSQMRAILAIAVLVMPISAFMNSTPMVIILTPVVISLARTMSLAPSRLLIPLSYITIFGGTTTLIGTSTNLLVNGVVMDMGMPSMGIFDITVPGLIIAAVGIVYMMIFGPLLLPDRQTFANMLAGGKRPFIAEIFIPFESTLIDKTIADSGLGGEDRHVLDVIRYGQSFRAYLDSLTLQAGDTVVLEADTGVMLTLKEEGHVTFKADEENRYKPVRAEETQIVEGIVGPRSRLLGHLVSDLYTRRFAGVYILGVHRHDKDYNQDFDKLRLRVADTLLLEGTGSGIKRLLDNGDVISLSHPRERPVRRNKAPIAIAAMLSVMILAALNVMPIVALALIAAFVVILCGCVEADEIYQVIDWRILFLIFGMLGVSMGMERTGAAKLIIDEIVPLAQVWGPLATLSVFYFLASALTEIISNNAVAVILAPLAIGLAQSIGYSPMPFLIAVMFAASASFATPIGYQTNTFVYSAGGYKFMDFVKIGMPLNFIMWIVSVTVIPIFWPF